MSENPYAPPASPSQTVGEPLPSTGGLTCPYCQAAFPLTWTVYFKSPFVAIVCPACQGKSRLDWPLRYFAVSIPALSGAILIPTIAGMWLYGNLGTFVGVGIGMILGFVIDKQFDERLRRLVK